MAESSPTVLAHVAWMLRGSFEDLAVEALGYILNRSEAAMRAFEEILRMGSSELAEVRLVHTQATGETGERPDLACLDKYGVEHVLIEAKFDAMLTKNQPVGYLKRLPRDRSSALLVVAPKRRLESLWSEMTDLVRGAGAFTMGEESNYDGLICTAVSECGTLMLVSWDHLLHRLAIRVQEKADEGTLRSIAELQGVIEYEALNAFQAPSKNLTELDEENKERFKELIDGAIAQGRRENWASTEGFTVGYSVTGYVRYFKIGEVTMWFGYDLRMWERYGGPLWVGFQEAAQNNIGAVREGLRQLCARRPENFYHDVPAWSQKRDFIRIEMPCSGEFPKLLGALVAQLHEIAHALQRVELSGSNPGE